MSFRTRLAALYAVLVFALMALVTGGVYIGLSRALSDETVSHTFNLTRVVRTPSGTVLIPEGQVQAQAEGLEAEVNDHALDELRHWSLIALAAGAVAGVVVGWVAAGRVLRPVHEITGVAREIQATDLSRRIALQGPPDELKELADTFDDMLSRLDDAFEAQRHFFQEASHELRNPLAVMRTNLDVALDEPDATSDELRRAGELASHTAERMSHTVEDLLSYARNEQSSMDREPVDLGPLVAEAAEEFRAPAAARDVVLDVLHPGAELWVEADAAALRQAVANLLDNAVRLAPEGSTVAVSWGADEGWAWAAVADEGPGIPADQQGLVFRRFWRGASDDGQRGSGLGLAIVDQVMTAHGGAARLASEPGRGSVFSLWLPRANT